MLKGEASFSRKVADGHLSRITTVFGLGAVTLSTISYMACRALTTPWGGKMILSRLAFTSREVSRLPSWNRTPLRMRKV